MINFESLIFIGIESNGKKSDFILKNICGKTALEWMDITLHHAGISKRSIIVNKDCDVNNLNNNKWFVDNTKENLLSSALLHYLKKNVDELSENILLFFNNTPLIEIEDITRIVKLHKTKENVATVLYFKKRCENVINDLGEIVVSCFRVKDLLYLLEKLFKDVNINKVSIYDIIEFLKHQGSNVSECFSDNENKHLVVNNNIDYSKSLYFKRIDILNKLMSSEVVIIDPHTTYIDCQVELGKNTIVYPNTFIEGDTKIGSECVIGPNSTIRNSQVGSKSQIIDSIVLDSTIGTQTKFIRSISSDSIVGNSNDIGPFSNIRMESILGDNLRIGNFVEIKKSYIEDDVKAAHLAYLGDSEVGKNVNIGCGVITVNYDGVNKHKTTIMENAFIGCNTNLLAPITIERNAIVAAGSTITDNVPEDSLALARSRQVIKEGWVIKRNKR